MLSFRNKFFCHQPFNFNYYQEKLKRRPVEGCTRDYFYKQKQPRPSTLLKKRPWHKCFPANFVKFLRTPFLQNTSGRLVLCKL